MDMSKATFRKILVLIIFTIGLYLVLQNIGALIVLGSKLIRTLLPIVLGLVFAFVLNVPMKNIERYLFERPFYLPKDRWYPIGRIRKSIKRPISLLLSLSILVGIFSIIIFVVLPSLAHTVSDLISGVPDFLRRTETWINHISDNNPQIQELFKDLEVNWQNLLGRVIKFVQHGASSFIESTWLATTSVFSVVGQFFISLILAIYILVSKESLRRQMFKLMHALMSRKTISHLLPVLSLANRTFSSYISGQFLEACILGSLTMMGMIIFGLPFVPVVTVLVIIMAMIPIVGSVISTLIAFLLILTQSPSKAFIWLAFFLILQQIEGNLIYPHVVGKSVKLPGLWVMIAITIGGSLAGIIGMLVSIPTFSVIYSLVRDWTDRRVNERRHAQRVSWFAKQGGLLDRMAGGKQNKGSMRSLSSLPPQEIALSPEILNGELTESPSAEDLVDSYPVSAAQEKEKPEDKRG